MLLTLDQAQQIEALQREWGDSSMASVVRRLLSEALEARRTRVVIEAIS